jgi:alkylation response protein AidB-like acyl-CoA dehydrogenase
LVNANSSAETAAPAETAGDMLRQATSRLLDDALTPATRAKAAAGEWPKALWSAVEELGLPMALLPEDAGGFGVPVADALSLMAVVGEYAPPLPLVDTMLAGFLLAKVGLEVPTGPLAVAPAAEVTIDASGRATGRAWDIPWGRNVGSVVVLGTGADGPALLVIPQSALTLERNTNIAGEPRDMVRFEQVAAPLAAFSAREFRATGAATRALMMAGALRAVSAMTAQYAQERNQFGRALGKFQAIQQSLAVLASEAAAAVAIADVAADAVATWGPGLLPAVAAAKIRTGEAAGIGAAIAHQIHGAIGFAQEHRLHEYTRRLWAWRDEFGREAEWARDLGRHLAAAGPDGLWPALTAV